MPVLHTKNHHKIKLMYTDGSETFGYLHSISCFMKLETPLDESQNSLVIRQHMSYTNTKDLCKFYGTYLENFT
jgi:hypothetical protein